MLYSSWNKSVLNERLKEMSNFALGIWSGSLFQSTGPAFEWLQMLVAQHTYDNPKS